MAYTLIQSASGEHLLVKSLDGHDGCTVVRKNVPEQPSAHHRLTQEGKWVEDTEAKDRSEIRKLIRDGRLREAIDRLKS
jgi:hypothetical protein